MASEVLKRIHEESTRALDRGVFAMWFLRDRIQPLVAREEELDYRQIDQLLTEYKLLRSNYPGSDIDPAHLLHQARRDLFLAHLFPEGTKKLDLARRTYKVIKDVEKTRLEAIIHAAFPEID